MPVSPFREDSCPCPWNIALCTKTPRKRGSLVGCCGKVFREDASKTRGRMRVTVRIHLSGTPEW